MKVTDDNVNPLAILELTEWVNLENADGPAFPDTPARLRDLVSGDFSAVTSSLSHLYSALLNDGVVYSATAPAFRYVAALLGERPSPAALAPPWEVGKYPLRGKLLTWLANVAYDVSIGQEQRIREWGKYSPAEPFPDFIDIRNIYPEAFPSVASYFHDSDSRVAEVALVVAIRLSESPALAEHRSRLAPLVENILAQSSDEWSRKFAAEALNAWRQGRTPTEVYIDPLPSAEYNSQEKRGSLDEPPF